MISVLYVCSSKQQSEPFYILLYQQNLSETGFGFLCQSTVPKLCISSEVC